MPRPKPEHGTGSMYRLGCRCTECRFGHVTETNAANRARADGAFPRAKRTRLLNLISHGASPVEAAEKVGVSQHTVRARARFDPEWAQQLDAALMAGRDPEVPHGSPTGYRHWKCRCPECQAAHRGRA